MKNKGIQLFTIAGSLVLLGACVRLALRAMAIAATVAGDAPVRADITLLDLAAECCSAAYLDGSHHAPLRAQEFKVGVPIGRSVAVKDVR